ncbi:hypothetical protein E8E14_009783 [Neopestalotiopsis sp. 37M]|nr:hypothetical protein E8E14_009783 [Neopestalotiopsis sp. 37M]
MLFSQVLMSLGSAAVLTLATDISANSRLSDIVLARQNERSFSEPSMPYSVVRRDQTFKSDPITLDTSWQNAILYQDSFSKGVSTGSQGNLSLDLGVQITCTTCYIKGSTMTSLTVAGSGDLVQILQNYIEAIEGDVQNITEAAIGIVSNSLEQDVVEFLNTTDIVAQKVENIADSMWKKLESIFGSWMSDLLADFDDLVSKISTKLNSEIEEDTQILHSFTASVEGVIKDVLDDLKKDLDDISFIPDSFIEEIGDFAEEVFDSVKDTIDEELTEIKDAFHNNTFALPTVDVDFNQASTSSIPEISMQFQLDAFELYMELDTMLSAGATYTLPLYVSNTPIGVSLGDDVTAGIVATIDLILDIKAQIDISSGFHLKFDDSLTLDIEMFAEKVSNIHFPGAQFEFLPVTISSSGSVITGVLRVGLKVALDLHPPALTLLDNNITFGGGLEMSVFANVAEFETTITESTSSDASQCELEVVEYFEFNIGAGAGAVLTLGSHHWGPTPATTIPLLYTTLASACAAKKTASTATITSNSAIAATTDAAKRANAAREDVTTTTLTSTMVFTGQTCASSGVIHCPAAQQITTTFLSVSSYVTAVASGVIPTFPTQLTSLPSVSSIVAFGTNVKSVAGVSGVPTSFDPSAITNEAQNILNGQTGGVSNKLILGLALGLGVPFLIAVLTAAM